jgi:exosortase F-associated protein
MASQVRLMQIRRLIIGLIGLFLLAISYLYQYTDVLLLTSGTNFQPWLHFTVNRIMRILLNDAGMILIINAIFADRDVLRLALLIQAIDLFILLPLYLVLKLPTEGVSELSSPFLSQFHRLIVNPILMILLIPALHYQRSLKRSS